VVGYLAFFTDETSFFDDEEMRLLRELAGDLAYALEHIATAERLEHLTRRADELARRPL
jgi:GAF domain-containing protein